MNPTVTIPKPAPLVEPIVKMVGEVRLKIKDQSTYFDKAEKKDKISSAKITLQSVGMEIPMTVSATALVGLYHLINDDTQIRDILRSRMAAEQPAVKTL